MYENGKIDPKMGKNDPHVENTEQNTKLQGWSVK